MFVIVLNYDLTCAFTSRTMLPPRETWSSVMQVEVRTNYMFLIPFSKYVPSLFWVNIKVLLVISGVFVCPCRRRVCIRWWRWVSGCWLRGVLALALHADGPAAASDHCISAIYQEQTDTSDPQDTAVHDPCPLPPASHDQRHAQSQNCC